MGIEIAERVYFMDPHLRYTANTLHNTRVVTLTYCCLCLPPTCKCQHALLLNPGTSEQVILIDVTFYCFVIIRLRAERAFGCFWFVRRLIYLFTRLLNSEKHIGLILPVKQLRL